MDWLTFIAKLVEALAWPAVVLVLGLVFRKKLLTLIPNLRKLKAGPVEAEFELAARQALANAEEVGSQATSQTMPALPLSTSPSDRQVIAKLRNARSDPTGVILEGWARVDGELFRFGLQTGMLVDPVENAGKVYQTMMSSDILPAETRGLVKELRDLRNKVAHVQVTPTSEAAQDYLLAVDRVVELIFNYRKNLPNYGPKTL